MLTRLIPLAALVVAASCACFDNGDKEIGGNCFRFVNQKLSFNDARDWCHYKNPVTASFLASVPNQFTDNFLATYARSEFGTNDGFFWIGLSREKSYTPWMFDTGYQASWTNFVNGQLGQNYGAESIVNGKWQTFGEGEKMPFVCMYDPTAPPTFGPPVTGTTAAPTTAGTTQSVPTTTDDSFCQHPQWTYTFFFAYSIELNADVFNSIVPIITNALSSYPYQGNILRDAFLDDSDERIRLPKDIDAFHADLVANPPIPKRPLDWTLPSNIVQIIENFFPTAAETSEYSGKTSVWLENSILLLLPVFVGGPYPDLSQSNYTSLINQNVKVFVLMNKDSSSNIYDRSFFPNLAARTNGHFVYADEEKFGDVTAHLMDSGYGKDLLYSRNCMMGRGKWHKGIGKFQTPKQHANGLVNVTVTLTDVSINVDDIGLNSFQVRFNIEQNNTNYTVSLVFIPGTNFHYATVQLPADTLFSLDAIMNALDPLYPIEVMMRMWIDRKYSQYAEYVDLDFRPTNPDDREGAALRMTVLNNCYQEERATVRFQNCDGEEDRVYETTQVTGIPIGTEGSYPKFASVPFFCPPSRACDVSYDTIYNVQLTVGEFSITRSFRCLDGVEPVKVGCSHLDLLGNYYCTRDALPYKRGLTGQLTDCLGQGHLEFDSVNTQDYVCVCDNGRSGVCCQNH